MPGPKSSRYFLLLELALAPACFEDSNAGQDISPSGCEDASCDDDDGDDDDGDAAGDDGAAATGDIPCDVRDILATHCLGCHGDPLAYGAPMSLVDATDFADAALSDRDRPVHELVGLRVRDDARPMPPTGGLTDAERATLLAWVDAGAPPDPAAKCTNDTQPPPAVGPDELPCTPTYTFTAHAPGSNEPFAVPEYGADNLYACFSFKSPLVAPTQAIAWAPITDDERVLHHWILFRTTTPQDDGAVGPCNMPSDAVFVAGWAPGGTNFVLPDDVGLELGGPDDYYIMQIHYHNAAHHADAIDASGVALCTVDTPREKTAGVVTLGDYTLAIPPGASDHEEVGMCPSWVTSYLPEPLHVIASFPHMHQLGRRFRTEILRGGSESDIDVLVDVPTFNFENQAFYPHEPTAVVYPGDAVRTTCTYDNPTTSWVLTGEATEEEMCFNFVLAYPIEIVGNSRQCM